MRKITIPQKMGGTGSIHDIASDQYDRVIKFRGDNKYAVVLSSYYGDVATSHATLELAIDKYKSLGDYSGVIIDIEGNQYNTV